MTRRVAGAVLLALLAASALYADNVAGVRERFPPPAAALAPEARRVAATAASAPRRSQPWWQVVAAHDGDSATTTPPFTIGVHALQWRVRWRCTSGTLAVQPVDEAGRPVGHPLADATCPAEGEGFSVRPGVVRLEVDAGGRWQATVEQQVNVPLDEPPAPAMASSREVASGRFAPVDRSAEGRFALFRTRRGRLALRLEDFYVTPNVDLEIRFSHAEAGSTSAELLRAPFEHVAYLPATAGDMNLRVPPSVDPARFRSVVVWCEPLHLAYAAAPLRLRR